MQQQYSHSRFANEIHCPKCRMMYDDHNNNNTSAGIQQDLLRVPVKVVPCGHTACRPCLRSHYNSMVAGASNQGQQQQVQPSCPLCFQQIEITQFDEAALTLLRSAQTEMLAFQHQHQINNYQNQNFYHNTSSFIPPDSMEMTSVQSTLGPLHPSIRDQIFSKCLRSEDAPKAEQVARSIGTLKRSIDFSKTEYDAAKEERDAAGYSVESKTTVVSTLQTELRDMDEKIKQMNLDRQVILHQLQSAIGEQTSCRKYHTECEMRLLDIQRRIQAEANELENRVKLIQQLAPGISNYL